jgi:hypothetical protein
VVNGPRLSYRVGAVEVPRGANQDARGSGGTVTRVVPDELTGDTVHVSTVDGRTAVDVPGKSSATRTELTAIAYSLRTDGITGTGTDR